MKKINWTDFVLEIITVFIGITVAFTVNNWAKNNTREEAEIKYLSGILVDLENETKTLEELLRDINYRDSLNIINQQKLIDQHMTDDELLSYTRGISFFKTYESSNTTFKALEASGKLEIISDLDLLYALVEHYASEVQLRQIDKHYEDIIFNRFEPYLIEHFDIRDFVDKDTIRSNCQSIIRDVRFANIALPLSKFNNDRKQLYEHYFEQKTVLVEMVEKKLK